MVLPTPQLRQEVYVKCEVSNTYIPDCIFLDISYHRLYVGDCGWAVEWRRLTWQSNLDSFFFQFFHLFFKVIITYLRWGLISNLLWKNLIICSVYFILNDQSLKLIIFLIFISKIFTASRRKISYSKKEGNYEIIQVKCFVMFWY